MAQVLQHQIRVASLLQEKEPMKTASVPAFEVPHDTKVYHSAHMIVGYLIFSAGIAVLVGAANVPQATAHDMWVLLTLAGAMVASSTAFLVNPLAESTGIKIGRALFAAACGVVGSRIIYTYWDSLRNFITDDKILIFGLGLACGFLGFIIAVRFIKTADKKAQDIVDHITKGWDSKYMPPVEKVDPKDLRSSASSRNNHRNRKDL